MRDSFGGGRSLEKKELISRQGSGSNLGRDPPLPCDTLSAPTLVVKSGLRPGMIPGIRPCLKFLFLRGGIVLLNNSRTKRCECFSSSHGLSSRFLKNEKISLWKLICQGYWREGYSKWFEIIERMHMPVQVFGDRV